MNMENEDKKAKVDHLRKKIDEVLDSRKKGESKKYANLDKLIEDINIYHQELEFQNEELARIGRDLEGSTAQLKDLFENAPIGYVVFDKDYIIKEANLAFCRISGKEKDKSIGKKITDFISPESQDVFYFHVTALFKTGERETCMIAIADISGSAVLVRIESNLLRIDEKKYARTAVLDISREKAAADALSLSEEKFRKAFYTSPDSIAITRLSDGLITAVNKGFTRLTGYSEDEVIGKTALDLGFWANPRDRETMAEVLIKEGKIVNFESRFRIKNCDIREGLMSAAVIDINNDKHLISITRDMTDQKNAETEKEKLQSMLVQSQKMESVGRLAGGVAHDFNNMLQVIIGYSDMSLDALYQGNSDKSLAENLNEIRKAAIHSAELVSQLLAFARKQTISPKVIDLNQAITGTLKMLKRLIGENIELVFDPADENCSIMIDPAQVDQILANIAVNARDSIEETGFLAVETSINDIDDKYAEKNPEVIPGRYVMLSVSDTGRGMDRVQLAKCFEPFYTTKKTGEGTGLGLSTVYGIVMQNRGFIDVYSEPGRGTTFKIFFPFHENLEVPDVKERDIKKTAGGNETILLVEDEIQILNLGKSILEKLGYTVLTARFPSRAKEIASDYKHIIDLLVTDIIMPEMDGRQLSKLIKKIRPEMKCLFMSGYSANIIKHWENREEAAAFIQKPFSLKDMAAKVRDVLDN